MKKTLIIGLSILSHSLFGQIPGKPIAGPIVFSDSLTVQQGDILYLGKGSDQVTGTFLYLNIPKNKTANTVYNIFSKNNDLGHQVIPQKNLNKEFAGKQLVVEQFTQVSSKKKGNKILGVINMKGYQFIEGLFFNNVLVDVEQALRSGEIIKISAPELTKKAPVPELLFTPFEMTTNGIEPVVVPFNNISRSELYNKATNWINSYYKIPNRETITKVPDGKITISDIAKNVKFFRIMDNDIFGDLPYLFAVDFSDNEMRMTFTLGGENGDVTDKNGDVIANTSPSHMFDKNGDVLKMSQIFKVEAEKIMNNYSYAMVYYLMK